MSFLDVQVYLAGPINGCNDDEAGTWREAVIARLGKNHCINPLDRDYRGREAYIDPAEIVEPDKKAINSCDLVLANCWKPGWGTPMEILYAWEHDKDVIAVCPGEASPWLAYHADDICHSLDEALARIAELYPVSKRPEYLGTQMTEAG